MIDPHPQYNSNSSALALTSSVLSRSSLFLVTDIPQSHGGSYFTSQNVYNYTHMSSNSCFLAIGSERERETHFSITQTDGVRSQVHLGAQETPTQ